MTKRINFFKESIKSIKTSGTITPSSRFLAKRMLNKIDFSKADVIVELGPGNGAITEYILKKLHPKATLICFEINQNFYNQLSKIVNNQLILLNVSGENILEELKKLNFKNSNYIISSLPLTIIPEPISSSILQKSYTSLKENGVFIQYQYSLTYYNRLKKVFGDSISLEFELLNIPPAFVYKCEKTT